MNDGPKLERGRSHRHEEMLIRFPSKPEGETGELIFAAMKEQGFRRNRDAQAWTLPLNPHQKFRAHQAAEALFKDIDNTLREQNGLPPVTGMGQGVA
jgi:hypothetical protein